MERKEWHFNLKSFGSCFYQRRPRMTAPAMDTLPPPAPSTTVPIASDGLELADELHKSLIEDTFFQTRPIYTYALPFSRLFLSM